LGNVSKETGLPVHVDGARLLNSALHHRVPVSELTSVADSVSLCLSKGIGAPVGSVLVGSEEFIKKARRYRKVCFEKQVTLG
jgi:threonine aldolase